MIKINLIIFDEAVELRTDDCFVSDFVSNCYSTFEVSDDDHSERPSRLTVLRSLYGVEWTVSLAGTSIVCRSIGFLAYTIEKAITLELQNRRRDLFFLHAASVSRFGRSVVIIGASGAGKSSLCWELCNSGYTYLSDELAPVDPSNLKIYPYPHAICIKRSVEGMPRVPRNAFDAETTMHIPVASVPGGVQQGPVALDTIIFLQGDTTEPDCQLVAISPAQATARLYANGLNQLSHDRDGLGVAGNLATACQNFTLNRCTLAKMRSAIDRCLSPQVDKGRDAGGNTAAFLQHGQTLQI